MKLEEKVEASVILRAAVKHHSCNGRIDQPLLEAVRIFVDYRLDKQACAVFLVNSFTFQNSRFARKLVKQFQLDIGLFPRVRSNLRVSSNLYFI